ncbi:MAG: DUF2076 domain-containing protein [Buchnera aphidicola (Tetraneura sorini)]
MKTEEKILIENLFIRLLKVEQSSSKRDELAEKLINSLIEKQVNAPYYLIQTVLVQETVLKKLNTKINELKKENNSLQEKVLKKNEKPSFLSGLFKHGENKKSNLNSSKEKNMSSKNYNNSIISPNSDSVSSVSSPGLSNPVVNNNTFLGNALQTAVGVAGGMVVGNMLTNMFQNKQHPIEEEIFTSVNNDNTYISNVDHNDDENFSSYEEDHPNSDFLNNQDDFINEADESSYDSNFLNDDYSSELEINDDNINYDDDNNV